MESQNILSREPHSGITNVQEEERLKFSNDDYPKCSGYEQKEHFNFGKNGNDSSITSTIRSVKNASSSFANAIANIGCSGPSALSPLPKAFEAAAEETPDGMSDDCFKSTTQGFNDSTFLPTYHKGNNNVVMAVGNEAQPCNKTQSDPGGDLNINRDFVQHSLVNDYTSSEGQIKEGLENRVSNNLAGIVISSGPGGHFETFEGIKIF